MGSTLGFVMLSGETSAGHDPAAGFIRRAVYVKHGRVICIEGAARLQCVPDSDGPDKYYLRTGDKRLEVTRRTFLQMPTGGPYRIFYLEGTGDVVSAIAMPGWLPGIRLDIGQETSREPVPE